MPLGLEQLRVDAGLGEAGHRVDLVDEHLAVGLDEEVAAGEAGAAGEGEGRGGQLADAGGLRPRRSAPAPAAPSRPRSYLASKSYQSALATISPGSEAWGDSLPSTEHSTSRPVGRGLDDHPRVVAAAPARPPRRARPSSVDAGDADAGAHPRGLDPERQARSPRSARASLLADRDELDLGDAARRRRAASGSACPCRSPRRARRSRRRGRRATPAGPGRCRPRRRRRAGPGRRRRRRAGRRPGVSSTARRRAPAPVALDRHRDHLVARPSRRPRATEAPERSETSCSEERPPERTATLIVLRLPVQFAGGLLADDDRHRRRPVPASEPGGGNWSIDAADFAGDFGFFFFDASG